MQVSLAGTAGAGIVDDVGAEDPEHPFGRMAGPKGQRRLMALSDACAAEGLVQHFSRLGAMVDGARLEDLRHDGTDHSWMWNVADVHGGAIQLETI